MLRLLPAALFGALFVMVVYGQPRFEAASIRVNKNENSISGGSCRGVDTPQGRGGIAALAQMAKANIPVTEVPLGRCRFVHTPLEMLIRQAYEFEITKSGANKKFTGGPPTGGPTWMSSEYFDIEAVAPDPAKATAARLNEMLRTLLADRFQLKTHDETRQTQRYVLMLSKGGPKMKPSTAEDGPRGLNSIAGQPLTARSVDMPMFAGFLAGRLGKPVGDETGLNGEYTFQLTWTPGDNEVGLGSNLPGGFQLPAEIREKINAANNRNPNGPSLFTALQEQLGLRLETKQQPVQYLIVDRAEKPSEN
jgi:uncharacterized protein (TIGR03435 family)